MKDNEKIFEAIGEIDEKYAAEAAEAPKKKKRPKIAYIAASIAAAALVTVGVGGKYLNRSVDGPIVSDPIGSESVVSDPDVSEPGLVHENADNTDFAYNYDLPENSGEPEKLSTQIMPEVGGMGFEGMLTYDVNELLSNNPCLEGTELTELPVFTYKEEPEKLSLDEMEEKLLEYAAALGKEVVSTERIDGTDIPQAKIDQIREKLEAVGEEFNIEDFYSPNEVKVDAGSVKLEMKDDGEVKISRNISDLKEDSIPYLGKEYDDAVQIAKNLSEEFFNVIQYQYPTPSIFRDYSYSGDAHTSYALYDDSPDQLTSLLNHNFRRTTFWVDGNTVTIRMTNDADKLECEAMYPIITEEEAFEKLLNGEYKTTVWDEMYLPDGMNADEVTFTGVCYRRTGDRKYMMPYYHYLAELHSENENYAEGLKEYGGYYVPAVAPEYIDDIEIAFN